MTGHLALLLAAAVVAPTVWAADIEFEGTPSVKVEVREGVAQTATVPTHRASEVAVRVMRSADGFLWASRKNVPLVKQESGAYVTYVATTGAGYIRVLSPAMRRAVSSLPAEQRDQEFFYMEHMVDQLGSITYFGK